MKKINRAMSGGRRGYREAVLSPCGSWVRHLPSLSVPSFFFKSGFHYIGMLDEIIGYVIKLSLQPLVLSLESKWLKILVL